MGRKKVKAKAKNKQKATSQTEKSTRENVFFSDVSTGDAKSKFTIDQILDKVDDYLDEFNYEMAQRFCQRALEMDADNVRALEVSGTLLLEVDQIEKAKQCFGRAIELRPDEGYTKYMYMGQLLTGVDAISCFRHGIDIMKKILEKQGAASADPEVSTEDISNAYCSIAEIYLTDECMADDAEEQCKSSLENAIAANGENPEAYQSMASLLLSQNQREEACEMIEKSVSLWLPALREADKPDGGEIDPVLVCPVNYPARVNAAKILIELEKYEIACEILDLLLDEEDQVVEVWYLLGWVNYLQKEDYYTNSRFYLNRAKEVAVKTKFDDDAIMKHIEQLLEEMGPEPADDGTEVADEDDEFEDEEMETESPQDGMEH